MQEKYIEIQSYWGVKVENEYIDQGSETLVVTLPGYGYYNFAPIMHYSYRAAIELGYDVLCIDYGFQKSNIKMNLKDEKEVEILINEAVEVINMTISSKHKKIIFIGKSLGTKVQATLMNKFTEFKQMHIYLTPVPGAFESIGIYDSSVVIGTEDTIYLKGYLKDIVVSDNVSVAIIEGANHSLETSNVEESLKILKDITKGNLEFMKNI